MLGFFCSFFKILSKFSDFAYSDGCIGRITSKSIRLQTLFIEKRFEVNKNRFFPVKIWEIQVIVVMIMLTRSSYRIFNPMRYTGE